MAQYPSATAADANLYVAVNNLSNSLNGGINSAVTTITVLSTTGFPTAGYITIDAEAISYTGTTGTTFTGCTRGADGTVAASHLTAANVYHMVVAAHHNNLKDEVIAVETDLRGLMASIAPVSAANTATSVLQRLAHVVSQIKNGFGLTNWYDVVTAMLPKSGGTMSGAIAMGANKITGLAAATAAGDALRYEQLNPDTFIGVGRNRIINGELRIDQANVGAAVTVGASGVYGPDMFRAQGIAAAGVYTFQQSTSTPPTGFTHFVRSTCTTADASIAASDLYTYRHFIEGNNVRDLLLGSASAKAITLSFWVRSSLTGIYCVAFSNNANDRSYVAEYTINSANTWEQKTITLTGDLTGTWVTDTGSGIEVRFTLAGGSTFQTSANSWAAGNFYCTSNQVNFMSSNTTRTHDVTGVQLELGSVATPFEYRPYGIEQILAKRYFQKLGGSLVDEAMAVLFCFSTTNAQGVILLPVELRSTPTISVVGSVGDFRIYNSAATGLTATAVSGGNLGTKSFFISGTVASGLVAGNASNLYDHTTTSYYSIDARF